MTARAGRSGVVTERIQINPEPDEHGHYPSRHLEVDGPNEHGIVTVTEIHYRAGWGGHAEGQIVMHTRDWCALFDWWAVNIWGMEGDDDEGEKAPEGSQPAGRPQDTS